MSHFRSLFRFSHKEVGQLLAKARPLASRLGLKIISTTAQPGIDHGKLLIIIPRRVGPAHVRNLIKRRVHSVFYEEKLYLNVRESALLVYPEARKFSFDDTKAFLIKAFGKRQTQEITQ